MLESIEVSTEVYFIKRENIDKTLTNDNMYITTKFIFESQLCMGKIFAPHDFR